MSDRPHLMKTCKFQGNQYADGCMICQYDGSRRRSADNCDERHCRHWRPTWWMRFFEWLVSLVLR